MVKFKQTWNDIGSWKTLSDLSKKNQKLNLSTNIFNNSRNSNVISDKKNNILK